jgi:two-component system, response regulator RegA
MAAIIVLDDVADAGVLVKRILERKGHAVKPFTDEAAALAHAAKNQVDLAILDMKLTRMTGVEALSKLRKASPKTRAIMLTGYPTLETARECLRLGACDYLVKPIDKDELERKVDEALKTQTGN